MVDLFCRKCGNHLGPAGDRFCAKCGTPIPKNEPSLSLINVPAPTTSSTSTTTGGKMTSSHASAGVLATIGEVLLAAAIYFLPFWHVRVDSLVGTISANITLIHGFPAVGVAATVFLLISAILGWLKTGAWRGSMIMLCGLVILAGAIYIASTGPVYWPSTGIHVIGEGMKAELARGIIGMTTERHVIWGLGAYAALVAAIIFLLSGLVWSQKDIQVAKS